MPQRQHKESCLEFASSLFFYVYTHPADAISSTSLLVHHPSRGVDVHRIDRLTRENSRLSLTPTDHLSLSAVAVLSTHSQIDVFFMQTLTSIAMVLLLRPLFCANDTCQSEQDHELNSRQRFHPDGRRCNTALEHRSEHISPQCMARARVRCQQKYVSSLQVRQANRKASVVQWRNVYMRQNTAEGIRMPWRGGKIAQRMNVPRG